METKNLKLNQLKDDSLNDVELSHILGGAGACACVCCGNEDTNANAQSKKSGDVEGDA